MHIKFRLLILIGLLCNAGPAYAHHSFAIHFVPDKIVSVSGVVTEFRFTNPHGLIFLTVINNNGETESWRTETNSPNVLRRRGWSKTSIKPGEMVTIEGYPTRNGSNSMRIYRVIFPDGRELPGQRRVLGDPPGDD